MTTCAVLAELTGMHIVIAVAVDATRSRLAARLRSAAVTFSTAQIGVGAIQCKSGTHEMIEAPA